MHRAGARRGVADRLHVFQRVDARQLLVGGERRVKPCQMLPDTRGDELILDRGEPGRALGMMGAHVVLQTIGMRDERGGHAFSS